MRNKKQDRRSEILETRYEKRDIRNKIARSDIKSLNANYLDHENQSHISPLEAQRSQIFKRETRVLTGIINN